MPANYADWEIGKTPHTDPTAKASRFRIVSEVPAIRVRGASYRGSQPITAVFELVDTKPQSVQGRQRFEVYCAWFGVKPFTRFPRLLVPPGSFELLPSYSGEVVDNIST